MKALRFADVASKGLAAGKRVFIRADLNVPLDHSAAGGGRITEDTRIRASVPCIRFQHCRWRRHAGGDREVRH